MTENLADMIRKSDDLKQKEEGTDLDINNELPPAPSTKESTKKEGADAPEQIQSIIKMELLCDWFDKHHNVFENINHVKVSIRGIDPKETIIFSVLHPEGGKDEEGSLKRKLRIWDGANTFHVPELNPLAMEIYNNGFQIAYDIGDDTIMKCYAVRTGLNIVYCKVVDGLALPYSREKIKKSDDEFNAIYLSDERLVNLRSKLPINADLEGLQIQYKQVHKHLDGLVTNQDAVQWILERQAEVMDVNHHLQLENIMIWLLS